MSDRDNQETTESPDLEPALTGHNYDGIQEYDNPLPGWWSWLFIATIVFSVVYFFIAVTTGTLSAVYAYEQNTHADANAKQYTGDAVTLMQLMKDPIKLGMGQGVFSVRCAMCHGPNGEGGVQCPNLTDEYWLDVKQITDIVDVVSNGRKSGAMPPWKTQLTANEVVFVSAYVASLRGKNLPGRAPEGVVIPPWSDK